jgi:ankyrin repeat protein
MHCDQHNPDVVMIMQMLLQLRTDPNANPEAPITLRDTTLHLAAELGIVAMVKLLEEYGGNIRYLGGNEETAAQRARVNGHIKIADLLESHSVP